MPATVGVEFDAASQPETLRAPNAHLVDPKKERGAYIREDPVRGEARNVDPQKAAGLGIDVLDMGRIARTGIPGFIIGNIAEDVLNRVECSVVILKPPGYESPLKV